MKNSKSNFTKALPFLLPSLLGFLLFSIVPIIISMVLSLTEWNGLSRINIFGGGFFALVKELFVGIDNFKLILTTKEFWRVLGNTAYFIVLYIPAMLITSLVAASILNMNIKGNTIYRVLYYIPVLTSWVAASLIWKWVLSPEYGAVNNILVMIGIDGPGWLQDKHWAMPGVVLASVWKDMGYFGLIFLGGLKGINKSYYEAAEIDGASKMQKFMRITLPLLSPVTFFVIIVSIINSFQLFPQVMIMTEGGPSGATQVIVERIYRYGFEYFKMGYAVAFSWILSVIIFVFTFIQFKAQRKWVHYES